MLSAQPSYKFPSHPGLLIRPATAVASIRATQPEQDPLTYSVVIENATRSAVLAYTLRISYTDPDGKKRALNRQFFNFSAKSNGVEIPLGAAKIVSAMKTRGLSQQPDERAVSNALSARHGADAEFARELATKSSVVVSVDLVVLDSGLVIGADEGNTLQYLTGYLNAERELVRFIKRELGRATSAEEIAKQLAEIGTIRSAEGKPSRERHAQWARARELAQLVSTAPRAVWEQEVESLQQRVPMNLHR